MDRKPHPAYNSIIDARYQEQNVYPDHLPAILIKHVNPPGRVRPHWHPGLEVIAVLQGELQFMVADRQVYLKAGEVLIVDPYLIHGSEGVRPKAAPETNFSVTFNDDWIQRVYPGGDLVTFERHPTDPAVCKQVLRLCNEAYQAANSINPAEAFRANSLLYELAHLIYSSCATGTSQRNTKRIGKYQLMAILGYIHDHFSEDVSAASLAKNFGYSREHFSRMFHAKTGLTCAAYLTGLRTERAQDLLLNSDHTIAEVAQLAGFSSLAQMRETFRRQTGFSPRQWTCDNARS